MIRIAIKTTGCQVNQADAELVRRALADLPVAFVPPGHPADVVVVNACAVTAGAERDGRAFMHRGRRSGASVVLAGCLATRVGRDGGDARVPGDVRVVPGTARRDALIAILRDEVGRRGDDAATGVPRAGIGPGHGNQVPAFGEEPRPAPDRRIGFRARPLVKVQDGCDCRCAYCIVPLLRGPSRSVPGREVEAAVRSAATAGASEVVLSGVDLAAWGRDLGDASLPDLVARLRGLGTGLRFRLSSVEPPGLTDRLLEAFAAGPDLCPHLHVPLQSGCDGILRTMRRPYRAAALAGRLRDFAAAVPGLAIGMDVIAGFPGETDADFAETVAFLDSVPVTTLHVFPFSPRPGTEAAALPGAPSPGVVASRTRALRDLSTGRRAAHARGLAGREVEVVDVRGRPNGLVESLAGDHTRVFRRDDRGPRAGRFAVRIASSRGADAYAAPDESPPEGP